MPSPTRELRLVSRPDGLPDLSCWELAESAPATPGEGEFLVEVSHVSVNPAMRGWMEDKPSYVPPIALGEVMRAGGVGVVRDSRHPRFPDGSVVLGTFGVRELARSDGRGVLRIDTEQAPPEAWIGLFGDTGLPAYFGLLEVAGLREGETVVVSAAAGAVGGAAGQIAKLHGCRAIGIVGSERKRRYVVEELGYDAAIDYRAEDVEARLGELTDGAGLDVFFDNVGGELLDAALMNLADRARVVICGAISQYNEAGPWRGPSNYWQLLIHRARMEGFLVMDYVREFGSARERMLEWYREGKLKASNQVVDGDLGDFPEALLSIFGGKNIGKVVLRLRS